MVFLLILGVVIAGVGIFGLVRPARMSAMIAQVTFTTSLRYLAATLRFAVGAGLFLVAEDTTFPTAIRILGGFSVLSGLAALCLSRATLQGWLDRVAAWPVTAIRLFCGIALAVGVFLIVAAR